VVDEMLSGSARNFYDVVVGARAREGALWTFVSAVLGSRSAFAVGVFNSDAAPNAWLWRGHLLVKLGLLRLKALSQNMYLLLLLSYFVLVVQHLRFIFSLDSLLPFTLTLHRV
jgi:hypothetical protein